VIAVFDGSTPCGALTQIACDDDTCVLRSRATFPVNAGSLYYILVAGFGGMQGTFLLSVGCQAAPANDGCAGAIPIVPGPNGPFSNQFATGGTPPPSSCATGFADLWFAFTPTCSAPYRIDTCGTGLDTILSVRTGCTGSIEIGCNDDVGGACTPGSQVQFDGVAGATYRVRVAGASPVPGSFQLNVSSRFVLSYSSPGGPGTIAFSMAGGPASGVYLVVITLTQGAFPNGAFFGIDATPGEVLGFISAGPPFVGSLSACGSAAIPSIVAPPLSGITIYSVALATDAALTLPLIPSPPVNYTIP
jgi:hypothetical protein